MSMRVAFLRQLHSNRWYSGAQIQALKTAEALQAYGIAVQFISQPDQLTAATLLHSFGLLPEYLPVIETARRRAVPLVVSPIFFKDVSSFWKRLRVATAPLWGRFTQRYRQQLRILRWACRLLPNTRAEAQQVARYFRTDTPMSIVPNGVDPRFAEGNPRLFREEFDLHEPFVLCVGRIERRKNQLRLVQALRGTGIPLVIIGECLSRRYMEACCRAADERVRFLPALPHDSPLLASAYAACRVFVLPSLLETPGLAALEAGVAGARVVVTPFGGAPEYFGGFARYPHPRSATAIRAAILEAWESPHDGDALRTHLLTRFSWDRVAECTVQAYREALTELSARQPSAP